MSDEERQEAITAAVDDALRSAVADAERGVVTKWLMVAETVGDDGERGVWTLSSADLKTWESLGFAQFVIQLEQARSS